MKYFLKSVLLLCMFAAALSAQVFFTVTLDSTGTGKTSTAKGTAFAVLSADASKLTYQVTYNRLSGNYTASHFHHSGGTTSIPFVGTTADGNTVSGTWENLTDKNVEDLLGGKMYVNIHSSFAPGGEIRGYLKPAEGIGMSVDLDGAQAGNAGITGRGTGWVVIDSSNKRIKWNATVTGLTTKVTAAHFHYAGTVFGTPFVDSASSGTWSAVSDSVVRLFVKGAAYLNVHTDSLKGGEIRGTVKLGRAVTTSVRQISHEVPASFELEQNFPNPFNPSTTIQFSLVKGSHVSLKIYDMLGREVRTLVNSDVAAGASSVEWNGRNNLGQQVASGMYVYRIESNGSVAAKKMMLLK